MEAITLFCPHCSNTAPQIQLNTQRCKAEFYSSDGQKDIYDAVYTITRCETCNEILVYYQVEGFDTKSAYGNLVYPQTFLFADSIPKNIWATYNDAIKIKNISPDAFVVLARKTLEEICKEKGIVEKTLEKSLKKLVDMGEIPTKLIDACNIVRLVGNTAAHASDIKINMLHVWAIDSFINVIFEYMYVAPKKIAKFREMYKEFSK